MKIHNIIVISSILIMISFSFYYLLYPNHDKKTNQETVLFLSNIDTSKFLENDNDKYVKNMSQIDLYARKSKSANEYIHKISQCSIGFSPKEKEKLIRCCYKADEFLKSFIYKGVFDCSRIANIKWKLALTYNNNNNEYEEGLPHTREDVIFLSKYVINNNIAKEENDTSLVVTLIHEKVHIYQRYYSMKELIESMGYKEEINISQEMIKYKRSNPDLDNKIYSKNGKTMIMMYKNNTPTSINDLLSNNFTIEHPYEEIAYDISNEYEKNIIKEYI